MSKCEVRRLHTVTYENGMAMQERLVDKRKLDLIPDQLLLLEHPPVITKGRTGKKQHLLASEEVLAERGVRYYETTRGGDITWHGPGQLVGYPIIHLGEGRRDVRKYVTKLENVITRTLGELGVEAEGSETDRGVWVGDEKIAALGVRISRWTTSHGFALNLSPDLSFFDLITPCGIPDKGVTSLARLTGRDVSRTEVESLLLTHFADVFDLDLVEREHDISIVKVVVTRGNEVLLLQRHEDKQSFWQPVTGRIDPGETAAEAARRELEEETGLREVPIETLPLRQSFVIDPEYLGADDIVFAEEASFHAEVPETSDIVISSEEHQAWEWLTFEQALSRIRWSDDREVIERVARATATRR